LDRASAVCQEVVIAIDAQKTTLPISTVSNFVMMQFSFLTAITGFRRREEWTRT
jgi:hypothetical protein